MCATARPRRAAVLQGCEQDPSGRRPGGLPGYGSRGPSPLRGRGNQSMRKGSPSGGRERSGACRRRTHESGQHVARRISCSITSWGAAPNGPAEVLHTRGPLGGGVSGSAPAGPCCPTRGPIGTGSGNTSCAGHIAAALSFMCLATTPMPMRWMCTSTQRAMAASTLPAWRRMS